MLALLLENVGPDTAVRIGNPDIWRAAVAWPAATIVVRFDPPEPNPVPKPDR